MKTLAQVKSDRPVERPITSLISLSKLAGVKVVDIEGYITTEFGEPMFTATQIILEDGRVFFIGAEHDCAYLEDLNENRIIEQEQIEALSEEQDKE